VRLLVAGASSSPTCGLRDYAAALEPELRPVQTVWWERDPAWSARDARRSARRFGRTLDSALGARPDAVLLNYAVFDWGARTAWDLRGAPVHVPALAARLARSRVPLVSVVHEAAYSFGEPAWQRKALAALHRAALAAVVAASRGVVVSTSDREGWMIGRRWLPRRPVACVPVCGPAPRPGAPAPPGEVAVMSFGADDAEAEVVIGAVRRLRDRGVHIRLRLLGQPGTEGRQAQRWRAAAAAVGCGDALSFSGVLAPDELSGQLGGAQVVVFPNAAGPVSGKTTIAAALGHGRPVVAIDGPRRWDRLADEGALLLADPSAADLAERIGHLLSDDDARARQGARAAAFFDREFSPAVCAGRLRSFVEAVAA
jgi:Glycosyl transferases group 1